MEIIMQLAKSDRLWVMPVYAAIVCVCALSASLPVEATDALPPKSDRANFEKMNEIIARAAFFPRSSYVNLIPRGGSPESFCAQALNDIRTKKGIQVVEPIVRTDDVRHPALRPWVSCWESKKFQERTNVYYGFGTRAFRLYRVEVDRNSQNGPEEVLYAEWDHKDPPAHFGAGFNWMETNTCTIRGGAAVFERDTRNAQGAGMITDSYGVLLRYKDETWALEIHGLKNTFTKSWGDPADPPKDPQYGLTMSTLPNAADKLGPPQICGWSTIRPQDRIPTFGK
jgi:hypothetical protein